MDVLILSDTHVPGESSELPATVLERLDAADHVIHAGDFDATDTLREVRALAGDLTAVYGNRDPSDIDLPAVASRTVEDVTFVVTHGHVNHVERAVTSSDGMVKSGAAWLDAVVDTARARAAIGRGEDTGTTVVGVGGHIHEVVDETRAGVRVLNPGTATGVGDRPATAMTATVEGDRVDVTVHED